MTASSKSAPKTSAFSRFIPREEIDAVSAWRFAAVDGSDELPPSGDAEPEAEPNLLLEHAVAEARQQAFADGFAHGHDAGGKEVRGSFGKDGPYRPMLVEILKFFQTGVSPVDPKETLEIYAFMEAADESKRQEGKPVTLQSVLEKARQDSVQRIEDVTAKN